MNSEVKKDLAVLYYENKQAIDSFIQSRSSFPDAGQGTWTGLDSAVVNRVYSLETKGRTDVVGKGEALCLLYWDDGKPAAGSTTSTATVDISFTSTDASVKAVSGPLDEGISFKVNGTLSSFKEIAQQTLEGLSKTAAQKFSGLWSTNLSQEQIFGAVIKQKASKKEFTHLVNSLNTAVRTMKGSGSENYVYLLVSEAGWKVIPKSDEGLTFGGITEGKVTVNYNMESNLKKAIEKASEGDFSSFALQRSAAEGPEVVRDEEAAFNAYKNLDGLEGVDETLDVTNLKGVKEKINDALKKIEKYGRTLVKAEEGGKALRQNRKNARAAIESSSSKILLSLEKSLQITKELIDAHKKSSRSSPEEVRKLTSDYRIAMRDIFGPANYTNYPNPVALDQAEDGLEIFVSLLGGQQQTGVSESLLYKKIQKREVRNTRALVRSNVILQRSVKTVDESRIVLEHNLLMRELFPPQRSFPLSSIVLPTGLRLTESYVTDVLGLPPPVLTEGRMSESYIRRVIREHLIFEGWWDSAKDLLGKGVDWVKEKGDSVADVLKNFGANAKGVVAGLWAAATDPESLKSLLDKFKKGCENIMKLVTKPLQDLLKVFEKIQEKAMDVVNGLGSFMKFLTDALGKIMSLSGWKGMMAAAAGFLCYKWINENTGPLIKKAMDLVKNPEKLTDDLLGQVVDTVKEEIIAAAQEKLTEIGGELAASAIESLAGPVAWLKTAVDIFEKADWVISSLAEPMGLTSNEFTEQQTA